MNPGKVLVLDLREEEGGGMLRMGDAPDDREGVPGDLGECCGINLARFLFIQ
jgi:hypothetical protein